MSISAPHDGYFVHGRNWQREKLRVGMSLWPGMALGELPDTSAMEAKVFVLESEAGGLAPGAAAEVVVDAHPTRAFRGGLYPAGATVHVNVENNRLEL